MTNLLNFTNNILTGFHKHLKEAVHEKCHHCVRVSIQVPQCLGISASCKTDPSVMKDTVFDTQFGLQCTALSENTITYLRQDQRTVSRQNYHPGSALRTSYQNFRICSNHLQFAILNEVPMRVFC